MASVPRPTTTFVRPATVDPFEIDRLEDEELDELPFGVVCLDEEGTILRYNAAEARIARLDRNTVIGRRFFGEVAPCTSTPEFEGRFQKLVGGAEDQSLIRFPYTFDFKFGALDVHVEMVRLPGLDRYYLLINRVDTLRPARDGLPDGFAAPRQAELDTGTVKDGVLRDLREQRRAFVPVLLFDALLRTCDRIAPESWPVFCKEWGTQWGRRVIVDLESQCLEESLEGLRDRTMGEVADLISAHLASQGWGSVRFDLESVEETGALVIEVFNSILVAANRRAKTRRCHLLSGLFAALMTYLADRRLHVEEVSCAAQGPDRCRFVVVGASRHPLLLDLIEQDASLATIRQRLTATRHGTTGHEDR